MWGVLVKDNATARHWGKMQVMKGQKVLVAGPPEQVMQQQLLEHASGGDALLDTGSASAEYPLCRLRH